MNHRRGCIIKTKARRPSLCLRARSYVASSVCAHVAQAFDLDLPDCARAFDANWNPAPRRRRPRGCRFAINFLLGRSGCDARRVPIQEKKSLLAVTSATHNWGALREYAWAISTGEWVVAARDSRIMRSLLRPALNESYSKLRLKWWSVLWNEYFRSINKINA